MAKLFIICAVRDASPEEVKQLEDYAALWEGQGHKVHLPHRDTDQSATGLEICTQNANAIREAEEVHIFYTSKSTGTHFDMGVAFGLNKTIRVIKNETYGPGKSFPRMLHEWEMSDRNG